MIAAPTTPSEPRLRHAGAAVAVLFFVNGATFSNWLPRIPEIRDRLGLGNAGLGATLLGGGLGGIVGSLLVGSVVDRFGSRRVLIGAAGLLSVGLPLIALVPEALLLLLVLTALGILDVFNDVAMNAQGVIVQTRLGRSIMNRLHAMWSMGFTAGALVGSAAAAAEIGVRVHLAVIGAVLLATVLTVPRWLIPVDPPANQHERLDETDLHDGPDLDDGRDLDEGRDLDRGRGAPAPVPAPARRRWTGAGVAMAFAALAAAALEVTPNDWAAVLMRDVFDAGRGSGFGTVACAGAMLVGRLAGDHVLDRVGERRLLFGAMGLAGAGASITVVAPVGAVALVGLAVWGLGLSVVFPQLYSAAARVPGMSAGAGLGSMLLGQRLGGMITAVAVGGIAGWVNLRVSFAIVAGTALVILVVTVRRLVRSAPAPDSQGATLERT